jgi:hypothetical protein
MICWDGPGKIITHLNLAGMVTHESSQQDQRNNQWYAKFKNRLAQCLPHMRKFLQRKGFYTAPLQSF